jgi:hypothetical protein
VVWAGAGKVLGRYGAADVAARPMHAGRTGGRITTLAVRVRRGPKR